MLAGGSLLDIVWQSLRVTAHIVRANRKIGNLQALDTVDVEAFIEDAVLDDAVALSGGHRAGLY